MKMRLLLLCACAGVLSAAAGLHAADVTNETVTSPPVYVPDLSHAYGPLPDGVLAWNSLMEETNAASDQESVQFTFSFTNVARRMDVTLVTNVITSASSTTLTNIIAITNFTPDSVTIVDAHGSCSCTATELPPLPWTIPPGSNGQISATVNLGSMSGMLVKFLTVTTDKGSQQLNMMINILPPVVPTLTDAERARDLEIAKTDRQAVFKGDCVTCHAKSAPNKYGRELFDAVCAICHVGEQRASFVPDLRHLKTPTNYEFWRTWTAHGKPGSLMPAFSTAEGGPLTDMQIATVAAYLNSEFFSTPTPSTTNAPAGK
jgi:mono/diheme cytochrome c family protein